MWSSSLFRRRGVLGWSSMMRRSDIRYGQCSYPSATRRCRKTGQFRIWLLRALFLKVRDLNNTALLQNVLSTMLESGRLQSTRRYYRFRILKVPCPCIE